LEVPIGRQRSAVPDSTLMRARVMAVLGSEVHSLEDPAQTCVVEATGAAWRT